MPLTWCWLRHRWTMWMWYGGDGLEVRRCLACRTLQWRGGEPPWQLLKATNGREEPKGA